MIAAWLSQLKAFGIKYSGNLEFLGVQAIALTKVMFSYLFAKIWVKNQ
ncbi:hypothetical protein H6G04_23670 [Calothrix membranacea FACHB-236]|nr:hypothetical protein [Calothrix membranacea FACHB-236]